MTGVILIFITQRNMTCPIVFSANIFGRIGF